MLTWLVTTALRLRLLVLALAVLLMVLGTRVAQDAAYDVFPEFAPPTVEIQTEAPGLSTEEVESLVSMPIENALNGTPGLATLRSKSVLGLSQVVLLFEAGTDLLRARQLVGERLATVTRQLPAVVDRPPVILQPLSSTSRAMKIGVWSKTLDQVQLTDLARWKIRPRLMAVRGVANVAIWGQRDRQFQVLVDGDRLRNHGVTLDAVERAARDAVAVGAGGFVDSPNQRLAVRHAGAVEHVEDLGKALVPPTRLRLRDVADVVEGHQAPIGDAIVNDQPGLLLVVEKHVDGNTLEVTRGVEAAMAALRPGLQDVEFDTTIFRPATFIERALANLGRSMLLGCGLVVLVLMLFLGDWRTAVISLTAIPLSIVTALLVIDRLGGAIDTMVLAGLVIALGEVVDDAIIDVENIVRRLQRNRLAEAPRSAFAVVLGASLEVRSAVVVASLIVVLVFLPVFFLDGLAGSFFRPLAVSYVLAIGSSLLVALTVTPALCLWLLPQRATAQRESKASALCRRAYAATLPRVLDRPRLVIAALAVAFVGCGIAVTRLGEHLLPDFRETDFLMHWVEPPGTSIAAMDRITIRASKELRAIEGVRNFGSHIGRAEVADEVVGPNFTELWISLDENADYATTVRRVQEVVDGYPGLKRDLLTYLKERIKEVLSGASATLVVRLFGPDLATLREKAQEVHRAMTAIEGVVDAQVESQKLVPQILVRLRPEAAEQYGLTPGAVRRAATTFVRGTKVGEVYLDQRIVDVTVWGHPRGQLDIGALRALPIDTTAFASVPLGAVADVEIVPTPNEIKREGASRRLDVTCNVRGRDLGSVAREVEAMVRSLKYERGYHAEMLGEYRTLQQARARLLWLSAVALLGIFVLLQLDFGDWRRSTLVFLTLPFALIGGVGGALLAGGVLSLGSLVGFVTVIGIAARNGIMLVSHYRHLEQQEGVPFGRELIVRGAVERLVPITMTAGCAALALVPLLLAGDVPGQEIEHPMAFVILGGLVTSTLLNLLVLPTLYAVFGRASTEA